MNKFLCIHGHFYQPPRENPWLEAIEFQESAYPYHDWNERIAAECYEANAASRILDGEARIVRIVNNYSRISFNFGATLLSWLQKHAPEAYLAILNADRESQKAFSGHGSALAQPYNHMILPLANWRDKKTQALWGIRDFQHRFGRMPEGMWLPETAVDLETLDVLADLGIRFTILAPSQLRRVRAIGARAWREVADGRTDPKRPYLVRLPSDRAIAVFVYDGGVSHAVAFERLLIKGEDFAARLLGAFDDKDELPQLVHIATDGETYGHHHRFGDMALAYALETIEADPDVQITNYGEFLERFPPTQEAEIVENTSWSCAHGVERWRADCGCNTGQHPGWSQAWRAPLRAAFDALRDALAPLYEARMRELVHDPWAARDEYVDVILRRAPETVERFMGRHLARTITPEERIGLLKLLELQRHALLMYTSCGWFFDDLSGIETVQVIQYAGRVVQLAQEVFGDHIEAEFLSLLEKAQSNLPHLGHGRQVYERFVKPSMLDLHKVGAHFVMSSLFEPMAEKKQVYCYRIDIDAWRTLEEGKAKLALGSGRFTCMVTEESAHLSFGALHLGDHNLSAGVRDYLGQEAFETLVREETAAMERGELTELIRLLDKHFGASTYSLKNLFRDEQRKIIHRILESTLEEVEEEYRRLHGRLAPLTRFLAELAMPAPRAFQMVGEVVLNNSLRTALQQDSPDLARIRTIVEQAAAEKVELDREGLGHVLKESLETKARRLLESPADPARLALLNDAAGLLRLLPFHVDVTKVQNLYYEMLRSVYPQRRREAELGSPGAAEWNVRFLALGEVLRIRVE